MDGNFKTVEIVCLFIFQIYFCINKHHKKLTNSLNKTFQKRNVDDVKNAFLVRIQKQIFSQYFVDSQGRNVFSYVRTRKWKILRERRS